MSKMIVIFFSEKSAATRKGVWIRYSAACVTAFKNPAAVLLDDRTRERQINRSDPEARTKKQLQAIDA